MFKGAGVSQDGGVVISDPDEPLVTLNDAAAELGVSRTMIRNLIEAGELKEFEYVGKVPRNAGRVYRSSLLDYQRRRVEAGRGARTRRSREDVRDGFEKGMSRREARADAAAHELKVAADLARQQSREIRKEASRKVSKLSRIVIQQAKVIDQLQADAALDSERTEQVLDAYSSALTQLLAPDDIGLL